MEKNLLLSHKVPYMKRFTIYMCSCVWNRNASKFTEDFIGKLHHVLISYIYSSYKMKNASRREN